MDTDDENIPDAKLLTLPEASQPGDIWRLWAARSNKIQEDNIAELALERTGDSPRHLMINPEDDPAEKQRLREQQETEQRLRDFAERQERLLAQIEQRQIELAERRQEIEDNALRLRDGRRVYVDGDKFRDEQGRVLFGAEEAEAARQHEYKPDASTWQQKTEVEREGQELRELKRNVVEDKGSTDPAAAARLTTYEQGFAAQAQKQAAQAPVNFGSADYMDDYGTATTVPAFQEAANPPDKATVQKDTDTTQPKIAPRLLGQGVPKPG